MLYHYNVLVVDDYKENVDSLKTLLQNSFEKLSVFTAYDAFQARKHVQQNSIDLILLDVKLPKKDGYTFAKELAEDPKTRSIPIVFLTAFFTDEEFVNKGLDLGAVDYITKPISYRELKKKLKIYFKILEKQKEYDGDLERIIEEKTKELHQSHAILKNRAKELEVYQNALEESDIVSKTDTKGRITYVNERFCQVSGYRPEELLGRSHNIVRHPDTPAEVFEQMWQTIQNKEVFKGIIKNRRKDGTSYHVDSTIVPILDKDDKIVEYIGIRHYVESIMNQKQMLKDSIKALKHPFLLLAEIEDFAQLEDFYDNEIIERIEQEFAAKVLDYLPDELFFDKVYRLDNGQFGFVKERESGFCERDTIEKLQEFQRNIKAYRLHLEDLEYNIAVHLSFAHGEDEIYKNAKLGLKRARYEKSSIVFANDLIQQSKLRAKRNINTIKMIKEAIENQRVISRFHGIFNNKTGEVEKYESLVRLIDGGGREIAPYFFIPTAKKGKYYTQITDIVFENSLRALEKTKKDISINISSLDIENTGIRNGIINHLKKRPDHAKRLIFELLEDEDMKDFERVKAFIATIKGLGARIAIDDFGSGYSSFERLIDFKPDILKIDGSLIKNITSDRFSKNVVETIQTFAQKEGIVTVAEFVADEEIYKLVCQLGVDYSQGFFLGKPNPL